MSDDFLQHLRREPRPGFARSLRERLREQDEAPRAAWRPWLAWAAAAAVVAIAFTFPAVRVSAQAVLDLFRVRDFTAVSFDPSRFEKLREQTGAKGAFDVFDAPGARDHQPARTVGSFAEAASASGLALKQPATIVGGVALDSLWVTGANEADLTVHTDKLRSLLDALELRDVSVPAELDGRQVHVSMAPIVAARYASERRQAVFVQSRSPEVRVPPGTDMARLGEIGLRVLGLDPAEARRLARHIDWANTLVVPVPVNASSFREVTVNGHRGLLVSTKGTPAGTPEQAGGRHRNGHVLLWSADDRVYALMGSLDAVELMQMAESVR